MLNKYSRNYIQTVTLSPEKIPWGSLTKKLIGRKFGKQFNCEIKTFLCFQGNEKDRHFFVQLPLLLEKIILNQDLQQHITSRGLKNKMGIKTIYV